MSKNSHKKHKKKKSGASAPKAGAPTGASEVAASRSAQPSAPSLGTRRVKVKVEKVSAKEQALLAKKAARARWGERITAEAG